MHENRPYPRNLRCLNSAQHCIAQKARTNMPSLKGAVHGKPTEQHGGNRVWHVAPDAAGRFSMNHRAMGESIVADDPQADAHNIGARCSARFILKRTPAQPFIECWLPAIEARKVISGRQSLGWSYFIQSAAHLLSTSPCPTAPWSGAAAAISDCPPAVYQASR